MNRLHAHGKRPVLPLAFLMLSLSLSLAFARPCAASEPAGPIAMRLPVDAYAPSALAIRNPDPTDDGRPTPEEKAWSVGPHREGDPPSRFERYAGTGALIGAVTGVTVMVIRTRGDDGVGDFFEPLAWCLGGAMGAAAGWVVGGTIALATGD